MFSWRTPLTALGTRCGMPLGSPDNGLGDETAAKGSRASACAQTGLTPPGEGPDLSACSLAAGVAIAPATLLPVALTFIEVGQVDP